MKAHLGDYLHRVAAGDTVIVTRRGQPVARILPVGKTLEACMQDAVTTGIVAWNGQQLEPRTPVERIRDDIMVAELLLKDRG